MSLSKNWKQYLLPTKKETFGLLDPLVPNFQCENAQPQQRTDGSVSADFPKPPATAKRWDSDSLNV